MDLIAKLKHARENIGLTQKRVSALSGIDDSSLSAFETGRAEQRLGQLARLAEVYRVPVTYFFDETAPAPQVVLWRNEPEDEAQARGDFLQLCRQYRQLEAWTNEPNDKQLPNIDTSTGTFHYPQVEELANNAREIMGLGDRPGQSLYTVLEEVYGTKIFHLDLGDTGTAASAVSEEFGQAILFNTRCSRWRRNHDLAHELFHLLTWARFNHTDASARPSDTEEKYATCFAGNLLLPADVVRPAIAKAADAEGRISFDQIDTVAREFDVSLESLIWRMHFLNNWKSDTTHHYVDQAKAFVTATHREPGEKPRRLPERYRALAIKALRNGDISQGRFAKFMNVSRPKVDVYMAKDGPKYAKIETFTT